MLRDYLQKRLQEIRQHHEQGAAGEQVMAALTDLTDEVIERIYKTVLQNVSTHSRWKFEDGLAIVALGGYGRGERSPYSDIDIMFLYRPSIRDEIEKIAGAVLQKLWDVGFQVGHSSRTVNDCVVIGKKDLTVRTSMMEARFLTGSRELFDQFRLRFQRKVIMSRPDLFRRAKIRSREDECEQYGTTTYLLEPNIKKSRGGLRDVHLLRWLAHSRYQTSSLELLKQQGILSKQDYRVLTEAQEFLWRVRNELHFFVGRCQDSLTFDEQMRLATKWGYQDTDHLLGVEQFMQRYYDHTTAIAEITSRYIGGMDSPTAWDRLRDRLTRKKIGDYFLLSGGEVSILPQCRAEVLSRGDQLLTLLRLAQENNAKLSVETQGLLTAMMNQWSSETFSKPESHRIFLSMLSIATGVADTLRRLHRFRILEQILPGLKRVRALMQFNQYHKYTVDEHCLRAAEEAEKILLQGGTSARVFQEIQHKEILYLALLSHDLGKGLIAGEHSEQGASIALDTAKRLGLDQATTDQFVFLVREHLLMTNVAFRRDLSDDQVLVQFAKTVAMPETLKMLYVLTQADITAVGPGCLSVWKKDLLSELFKKTLEILTGESMIEAEEEKVKRIREWVRSRLRDVYAADWLDRQLSAMTSRYLVVTPPERIILDLERVHDLWPSEDPALPVRAPGQASGSAGEWLGHGGIASGTSRPPYPKSVGASEDLPSGSSARAPTYNKAVQVYAENDPDKNLTEYGVYTFDDITPGIFYKITAVLAAKGLQILSATITTWSNNVVVDTFQVQDPDFSGPPVSYRLQDVQDTIALVLLGQKELEHPSIAGARIRSSSSIFPRTAPVQVEVDNSTSEKYTIVEMFAHDRPGLLSVIAQSLFTLGLSVQSAKVATHLDQIVDIFHVTDRTGQKITDPDRIRQLKQTLKQEIEQYLETSRVR